MTSYCDWCSEPTLEEGEDYCSKKCASDYETSKAVALAAYESRNEDLQDCNGCGRQFAPGKSDAQDFEHFCTNECEGGSLIDDAELRVNLARGN